MPAPAVVVAVVSVVGSIGTAIVQGVASYKKAKTKAEARKIEAVSDAVARIAEARARKAAANAKLLLCGLLGILLTLGLSTAVFLALR